MGMVEVGGSCRASLLRGVGANMARGAGEGETGGGRGEEGVVKERGGEAEPDEGKVGLGRGRWVQGVGIARLPKATTLRADMLQET